MPNFTILKRFFVNKIRQKGINNDCIVKSKVNS